MMLRCTFLVVNHTSTGPISYLGDGFSHRFSPTRHLKGAFSHLGSATEHLKGRLADNSSPTTAVLGSPIGLWGKLPLYSHSHEYSIICLNPPPLRISVGHSPLKAISHEFYAYLIKLPP